MSIILSDYWETIQYSLFSRLANTLEAPLRILTIEDLAAIDVTWKPYLDSKVEAAKRHGVRWWRLLQHQEWDWGQRLIRTLTIPTTT